jgi:phosphonate dehydrogenase
MQDASIVITHRVFLETIEELSRCGRVQANHNDQGLGYQTLLSRSREADALMVFMPDKIDADLLENCPKLKIVACALKGYDNIDVNACTRQGVWVSIVPDLLSAPTADLAVGLLLAVGRNIIEGDRFVRSGRFRGWRPLLYGRGLQGKTAGIVGFGKVGKLIARRLRAFDMRVCCFDPAEMDPDVLGEMGVQKIGFNELVRSSDYIFVAAPLHPFSLHLFNRDTLARIKRGAFLINVGRGSVVDEHAAAAALENGMLAGYAADVFELEDLSQDDRPLAIPTALLHESSRTVFTPHLGSAVDEVRLAIEKAAAANIIDVLEGRPPRNAVNRLQAASIK